MPNKKISQLVNKTTILSTDLFPIGDATSGQLYKKTIAELQAAIGGAVISVNGLVGTVVLDTDDIQELATPTNKYFTDARARAALSATSPLAFNSSTGVFSMPAATTSANGYLTSTDWNTFNGKENVLTFSSPLVRTSNTISMPAATTSVNGYLSSTDWNTFNNKQGALTLTVTGSSGASTLIGNTLNVPTYTLAGLGGITASFLSGGTGITYNSGTGVIATTITQYTDALARASLSFAAGSGAYNSTTGVITIPTNTNQLTNGASFITLGSLSGGTGITYNSTTGAISYSGTVYTDASIRGLFSGSTGISYNSTTGAISSTITQYTDALARGAISLTTTGTSGASTYNSTTGVLNIPNYGSALSGYLPLTGGTLTGSLGGTTASFSASYTGGGSINIMTWQRLGGAVSSDITYNDANTSINFGTNTAHSLNIKTNNTTALSIASSGAATFSSSVTAQSGVFGNSGSGSYSIRAVNNDQSNVRINLTNTGTGGQEFSIIGGLAGASNAGFSIYDNTNATTRLYINSSGSVGINTSSPSYLLDVNGIGRFSGGYQTPVAIFERNADYGQVITLGRKGVSASAGIGYPNDGNISFLTGGTERVRIDASGNLGLGVTPSALEAASTGIQSRNSTLQFYDVSTEFLQNAYVNTSGSFIYKTSNYAERYQQYNGVHAWYSAPSGTAGTAITFTQAMTLASNGNLLLGTSTDSGFRLNLVSSSAPIASFTGSTNGYIDISDGTVNSRIQNSGGLFIGTVNSYDLNLRTNATTRLTIAASNGAATFSSSVSGTSIRSNGVGIFGFNTANNGEFQIYATALDGMVMAGRGSSNDMVITNKSGSDVFRIPTGTTTAHFIGSVGINTSSPSEKLQINGNVLLQGSSTVTASIKIAAGNQWSFNADQSGGGSPVFSASGFYLRNENSTTNVLGFTVGGAATFSSSVTADGIIKSNQGIFQIFYGGTFRGGLYNYAAVSGSGTDYSVTLYSETNLYLASGGSATQKVVITSGGNILLGTTTDNGERLYVSGSIRATGTITANSDIRLKKNLERIENALEKVGQISGYTYNTIYDDKRHGGVIAQEIDDVFPEIVNKGNDGLLGVEYGNISALLIEALKEATTKIKALESKVEALQK